MIVKAILEWDEDAQSYSATCPELNYISSCGDTKEEAIENLKDAIQLLEESGISKKELAQKLNLSELIINQIENYLQDISMSILEKYAQILGKELVIQLK